MFHDGRHAVYVGLHVFIAVFHGKRHCAVGEARLNVLGNALEDHFLLFIKRSIVVANQKVQFGMRDGAFELIGVKKALAAFGGFGRHIRRQGVNKGCGHAERIHHLSFGAPRVNADPLKVDDGRAGIEVFALQGSDLAAVNRDSPVCAEALQVKIVGASSDFLVRRECYAEFGVSNRRISGDFGGHIHNGGNAGLIVSAKERRAVGKDHVFPDVLFDFRKALNRKADAFRLIEQHISPFKTDDLRFDLASGRIGRRVHMGDKADSGQVLAS